MALTKKQIEIVDVLRNGGYIWRAGNTYYLTRIVKYINDGKTPQYQSEHVNSRTLNALLPILIESGDGRMRLKV